MQQGEMHSLSFKEYRSKTNYVSVTELKTFDESPYTYYKKYLLHDKMEQKRNASFTLGTLVHCLILEPEKYESEYIISDIRRDTRTKAYQDLLLEAQDKTIITQAEYDKAKEIADNAKPFLPSEFIAEASFLYEGENFHTKVKSRFDAYCDKTNIIYDIKTTNDLPTADNVLKTILNLKYHWQVAFYWDIFYAVKGFEPEGFEMIFCQTNFPYAVCSFRMDSSVIDVGHYEYKKSHKKLSLALQNKDEINFPKIVEDKKTIYIPDWYKEKIGMLVQDVKDL